MLGPKAAPQKLVMTPAEAERELPGFSRYRIKEGIKSGQIPSVTLGQEPMIPRIWVERMREELLAPKAPTTPELSATEDLSEAMRALAATSSS